MVTKQPAGSGAYLFLFPGQGAQTAGMAVDLYEKYDAVKKLFSVADDVLKTDSLALLRDSTAEALKQTEIAQLAIALAELAVRAALTEHGVHPVAVAGHSLGEYPALAAAGVLDEADTLRLVAARGRAFAEAVRTGAEGGMAAVLGLSPETVENLVTEWTAAGTLQGLYAANFNSARQTVVSGTHDALEAAEPRFKEAGAKRFIPLAVSGPFHSPLMEAAAAQFSGTLSAVTFHDAKIPFFSNVTGKEVRSGAELKTLALQQITAPVRWTAIEERLAALAGNAAADSTGNAANSAVTLLETGPGRTLSGLWKDTGSVIPCYPAGTAADIAAVAQC